jgi:hypothetical protein
MAITVQGFHVEVLMLLSQFQDELVTGEGFRHFVDNARIFCFFRLEKVFRYPMPQINLIVYISGQTQILTALFANKIARFLISSSVQRS